MQTEKGNKITNDLPDPFRGKPVDHAPLQGYTLLGTKSERSDLKDTRRWNRLGKYNNVVEETKRGEIAIKIKVIFSILQLEHSPVIVAKITDLAMNYRNQFELWSVGRNRAVIAAVACYVYFRVHTIYVPLKKFEDAIECSMRKVFLSLKHLTSKDSRLRLQMHDQEYKRRLMIGALFAIKEHLGLPAEFIPEVLPYVIPVLKVFQGSTIDTMVGIVYYIFKKRSGPCDDVKRFHGYGLNPVSEFLGIYSQTVRRHRKRIESLMGWLDD